LRKEKAALIEKNLKPIRMDQYNAETDQAMEDSKNGRMIKATDLKAKIQKLNWKFIGCILRKLNFTIYTAITS